MEKVIKQHTLQSRERILLVQVPANYDHRMIDEDNILVGTFTDSDGAVKKHSQCLPVGTWQFIAFSDEITEEQAKGLVDTSEWYDPYQTPYGSVPCYKGYIDDVWKWEPLESFKSLMQSLGCEGRYAVLKEVKA